MNICICICIYLHGYIYIYICKHNYTYKHNKYKHTHTHTYVYIYMYMHMNTCIYVCILYICICIGDTSQFAGSPGVNMSGIFFERTSSWSGLLCKTIQVDLRRSSCRIDEWIDRIMSLWIGKNWKTTYIIYIYTYHIYNICIYIDIPYRYHISFFNQWVLLGIPQHTHVEKVSFKFCILSLSICMYVAWAWQAS